MSQIVVIADDLTGAADAGIMFCPYFQPVYLCSDKNFIGQESLSKADVIAIYTDSRAASPEVASNRLKMLLVQLKNQPPTRLFKKIDSSLRGNIGFEIDTIVEQTNADCSFVSAAFPDLGRTTVNGIHAIHGVPLAETELCHDPSTPVTESRVTAVIGGQSHYPVGHVDLSLLDGQTDKLIEAVERLRNAGCRHLVFDTTTDTHLDRISSLANVLKEKVLLVGTAGLAKAAARQWATDSVATKLEELPDQEVGDYPLYICGTAAEKTALQVENLVSTNACEVVNLDPDILADRTRRDELQHRIQDLLRTPSKHGLVVRITPQDHNCRHDWPALEVAANLGLVTAELIKAHPPGAIFCCGGDTASSVMSALGSWSIELRRLIVPGMVLGCLRGGIVDGLSFITKPGSFGRDDDLITLHDLLIKEGNLYEKRYKTGPGNFCR